MNKNINLRLVKTQYKDQFNNIMDATELVYNSKNEPAYVLKGNSCLLDISYYFKSIEGQVIFWELFEQTPYDYNEIEEYLKEKYNLVNFKLSIVNKQKYKLRQASALINETTRKI